MVAGISFNDVEGGADRPASNNSVQPESLYLVLAECVAIGR